MASLNSCRHELASIIGELENIKLGIQSEFSGIGENNCASCIDAVISKYRSVQRILSNVDTTKFADWVNKEG